VTIFDCG
jgi:hypothetical protein